MENVSANKLNTLKNKKEKTEKAIVTSFLVHLALMVVELLTMLIILNMADLTNIVRTIFVLVIGLVIAILLYLTGMSFIDRVSEEMLSFWHCIKIAFYHKEDKDVNCEPRKKRIDKFRQR